MYLPKNYDLLKEALYCRTVIFFAISSPTIFHKPSRKKSVRHKIGNRYGVGDTNPQIISGFCTELH